MSVVNQERRLGLQETGSEPPAPFLDRLVARGDLMTFGVPAVPIMLTCATGPSLIASVQQVGSRPSSVPLLITILLPVLWLGFWLTREIRSWARPVTSARWLQAVRAVVGEQVMNGILDHVRGLGADHLVTYRDVVDEFWGQRIRGWKAIWRTGSAQSHGRGRAS